MATPTPKIGSGTGLAPGRIKGPPQRTSEQGTPSPGAGDPGVPGGTRSSAPSETKGNSDRKTGAEYDLPMRST